MSNPTVHIDEAPMSVSCGADSIKEEIKEDVAEIDTNDNNCTALGAPMPLAVLLNSFMETLRNEQRVPPPPVAVAEPPPPAAAPPAAAGAAAGAPRKMVRVRQTADTIAQIRRLILVLFFRFSNYSADNTELVYELKRLVLGALGVEPSRIEGCLPLVGLAPPTPKYLKSLPVKGARPRVLRVLLGMPDKITQALDVRVSLRMSVVDDHSITFDALKRHDQGSLTVARIESGQRDEHAVAAVQAMASCGDVSAEVCTRAATGVASVAASASDNLAMMLKKLMRLA